jgi:hypothetical protein
MSPKIRSRFINELVISINRYDHRTQNKQNCCRPTVHANFSCLMGLERLDELRCQDSFYHLLQIADRLRNHSADFPLVSAPADRFAPSD